MLAIWKSPTFCTVSSKLRSVQQVSSSAGMFIDVKLGGKNSNASFVPKWVSPAWDNEPDQLGAINKAIVNALKGSFEPSRAPVSSSIPIMNFKTLSGGSQPALAIMMDVPGGVLTGEFLAALLASLRKSTAAHC